MYSELLIYMLKFIAISNLVLIGIILFVILVAYIFKRNIDFKKTRNTCCIIILCIFIECAVFAVPKIIDIKKEQYISVENVTLSIEAMNEYDGSFLVYGIGNVKTPDGEQFNVTGTWLIDLPTDDSSHQEFTGTIVYAKYSKQILDFKLK